VGGLQGLQLPLANTRNDVKPHIALVGGVRGSSDAGFGDLFQPVGHVLGDAQRRGGYRDSTALVIANLVELIEHRALGIAVDADAFPPTIGCIDEGLRLPPAIGAAIDAAFPVGVSLPALSRRHHATPSMRPAT
jgi:hypothetical protein